jgi:CO/xanthine dehydrogenase Mo-binding subunit
MTKKRGIGIASNLYGIGYGFNRPDHAAAYIEIGEDGTITLLTGCAEIGQGSSTILAQIAAEELGIDYESVRIITADTSVISLGAYLKEASSSSSETLMMRSVSLQ